MYNIVSIGKHIEKDWLQSESDCDSRLRDTGKIVKHLGVLLKFSTKKLYDSYFIWHDSVKLCV